MKSKEPQQKFVQTILENGIFNVEFKLVQMKFYFYSSSSSSNIITGEEDLIECFFKHRHGIIIFSICKHLLHKTLFKIILLEYLNIEYLSIYSLVQLHYTLHNTSVIFSETKKEERQYRYR